MMKAITESTSARFANLGFLAAVLVVSIHIGFVCDKGTVAWWARAIIEGVQRMAVPFFFLASGYFLAASYERGNHYRAQLRKRVSTLLVPYLVWNLLWIGFICCAYRTLPPTTLGGWGTAFGLNIFKRPAMGFLWFIRLLLILVVISPIFLRLAKSSAAKLGAVLGIGLAGFLFTPPWADKEWFLFAEYGLCFEGIYCFYLGMVMFEHPRMLGPDRKRMWVLVPVGVLLIVFKAFLDYWGGYRVASYWLGWLGLLSLIIGGMNAIPARRLPKQLLSATFPLYLVHPFVVTVMAGLIPCLGPKDVLLASTLFFFVRVIFAVIVSIGIAVLMKRFLPRVSSTLFGGR